MKILTHIFDEVLVQFYAPIIWGSGNKNSSHKQNPLLLNYFNHLYAKKLLWLYNQSNNVNDMTILVVTNNLE